MSAVILAIKSPQAFDGHPFDVGPVAHGRLAVIVPFEGRRGHGRLSTISGVFSLARTRCHDGHFLVEVLFLDVAVDEGIRGQLDAELQAFIVAGHRFIVISPVQPGGAIGRLVGAVLLKHLVDVWMGRRPLEAHVLQQVSHAGFAVALVPRANQHRHVDRHG